MGEIYSVWCEYCVEYSPRNSDTPPYIIFILEEIIQQQHILEEIIQQQQDAIKQGATERYTAACGVIYFLFLWRNSKS